MTVEFGKKIELNKFFNAYLVLLSWGLASLLTLTIQRGFGFRNGFFYIFFVFLYTFTIYPKLKNYFLELKKKEKRGEDICDGDYI
jgi:hypothetical protein